jgi:hypothetical protein
VLVLDSIGPQLGGGRRGAYSLRDGHGNGDGTLAFLIDDDGEKRWKVTSC